MHSRATLFVVVTALLAVYPLLVWLGLTHVGAPVLLGALLTLTGIRITMLARGRWQRLGRLAGAALAVTGLFTASAGIGGVSLLRWYPVIVSLVASSLFTASLFTERPLIERIARLRSPELTQSAVIYTRRLTGIWALLTFANALVAAWTAQFASLDTWALYNGVLSYLVLGGFFAAELLYRHRHVREA